MELGLQPSPSGLDLGYYRSIAQNDPNVALAGLRIELEILGRNLAKGSGVVLGDRDRSATAIFRKLLDNNSIDDRQFQLIMKVIVLCNAAIHGATVSREQAEAVLDIAKTLADDYSAWLSWAFTRTEPTSK